MKSPWSLRHVTDEERAVLTAGRRSPEAFTVRRGQMWRASAERQHPAGIAQTWRCAPPTVRHVLHACHARGLACMRRGAHVPLRAEPGRHAETREPGRVILHHPPRTCGQPARMWTLKRWAAVCHEQGVSDTPLSCPTLVDTIVRLRGSWPRANPWLVSPDSA
jgi:hypothetical protein